MSIKSQMLAAAAVLTLAGGLSAAGTVAASAATPQCANKCLTPRSAAYPGFVETVLLGIPLRGMPTIVSPAAGWNPGEDFTVPAGGPMPASSFVRPLYGGVGESRSTCAPGARPWVANRAGRSKDAVSGDAGRRA